MNTSPISLSTRAAARLAEVEPHLLYTHYRRYGHWRGVVPGKGDGGRLCWPAREVLALALPPEIHWPLGTGALSAWLDDIAPGIDDHCKVLLSAALLSDGSDFVLCGRITDEGLEREGRWLKLLVLAWASRLKKRRLQSGCPQVAEAVEQSLARACDDAFRRTPRFVASDEEAHA